MDNGPSLRSLSVSIVLLLAQGAAAATDPTLANAVGLAGVAREAWRGLARLRDDAPQTERFAQEITARLEKRVGDLPPRLRSDNLLPQAVTGVEVLVGQVADKPQDFVMAVRDREGFRTFLRGKGRAARRDLDSQAEPIFDELVTAVEEEILRLAPDSPLFEQGALRSLLDGMDEVQASLARVEDGVGRLAEAGERRRSGPIRVSSGRPMVSASFVERDAYERLLSCVVTTAAPRTVLVGGTGCGKSQLTTRLFEACDTQGWPLLAWISAESRDSLLSGLVELGREMRAVTGDDRQLSLEAQARLCLNRLSSGEREDRLCGASGRPRRPHSRGPRPAGGGNNYEDVRLEPGILHVNPY